MVINITYVHTGFMTLADKVEDNKIEDNSWNSINVCYVLFMNFCHDAASTTTTSSSTTTATTTTPTTATTTAAGGKPLSQINQEKDNILIDP